MGLLAAVFDCGALTAIGFRPRRLHHRRFSVAAPSPQPLSTAMASLRRGFFPLWHPSVAVSLRRGPRCLQAEDRLCDEGGANRDGDQESPADQIAAFVPLAPLLDHLVA